MSHPQFTVIYPGTDIRGTAVNHLKTWTNAQTLSPDRYRVVAVVQPGTDDEGLRHILGQNTILIHEAGAADTAMWNAGAAESETPWLVFIEGRIWMFHLALAVMRQK